MADTKANLTQPLLKAKTISRTLAHLNLKLLDSNTGSVMQFRIKTKTPLKKLMATYCDMKGLDIRVCQEK